MAPPSVHTFPPEDAYRETILIRVGENDFARTFTVHKGAITFYSGYFEGALRHGSAFAEAATGMFDLPDEDPIIFEKFVYWLYNGKINGERKCLHLTLCKLWVFADFREVPLLMNDCIGHIKDKIAAEYAVPVYCLAYIYDHTTPESALRRLMMYLTSELAKQAILRRSYPSAVQQ